MISANLSWYSCFLWIRVRFIFIKLFLYAYQFWNNFLIKEYYIVYAAIVLNCLDWSLCIMVAACIMLCHFEDMWHVMSILEFRISRSSQDLCSLP